MLGDLREQLFKMMIIYGGIIFDEKLEASRADYARYVQSEAARFGDQKGD